MNPRPVAILIKDKSLLMKKRDATAYDWHRLADEFAMLDEDRQMDICLMFAKKLESKADPDVIAHNDGINSPADSSPAVDTDGK